jgi:hypothetical protein
VTDKKKAGRPSFLQSRAEMENGELRSLPFVAFVPKAVEKDTRIVGFSDKTLLQNWKKSGIIHTVNK